MQKAGVPLARGTLINHCTKDPGFMAFILEIVPIFIKVSLYLEVRQTFKHRSKYLVGGEAKFAICWG